eukprot:g1556.t1
MAIDTASLDLAGDVLLYDVGVTSLLFFFLLIICTADNDVLNHWFKDVFGILAKKYEGSNGGPFFVMWAAIGSLYLGSVSLWASSAAWSVKHVVILLNVRWASAACSLTRPSSARAT